MLVEVGGDWCKWCHIMDGYYEQNPPLLELREKNYVMVKINFSPGNLNEKVLSRYPKIPGYPHIFILDGDGKLVHDVPTNLLEAGESYDLTKFTAFLKQWSPPGR